MLVYRSASPSKVVFVHGRTENIGITYFLYALASCGFKMQFGQVLTLALGLLAATIAGCGRAAPGTSRIASNVLPVRAIKTNTQEAFSYPIAFYGRIQPTRSVSLAFEIPGQITELLVDEGDTTRAGETLARLDTSILDAERKRFLATKLVEQAVLRRLKNGEREEVIAAARATVSKFVAELEQAVRERERFKKLREGNTATESEYEAAFFTAKSLQASLDAAKARLLELERGTREEDIEAQENRILELDAQVAVLDARIQKAALNAPFAANILKRLVDEGAVVQDGEPVFGISEAQRHEARFSVPVQQLEEARLTTTVIVDGNQVPVQRVRTISSVSDATRTVDVIFTLAPDANVIAGQTCTLDLTERSETPCVELPVASLVPSVRGLWSVYRLQKQADTDNFLIVREEVTIHHTNGDRVFVETSLPDGSLVVGDGVHKLVPGMVVRLTEGEP